VGIGDFQNAVADYRKAATLARGGLPPKYLVKLAECEFALGDPYTALRYINPVLADAPREVTALTVRTACEDLISELDVYRTAKARREWSRARNALLVARARVKHPPVEWLQWEAEIDLADNKWEGAGAIIEYAFILSLGNYAEWNVTLVKLWRQTRIPRSGFC
jgi:DnaJ family protein C protein 7